MRARWRWLLGLSLAAGVVLAALQPWQQPGPQPVYAQGLTLGGFTGAAYDVNNYASVQAALDAIPSGSRLYFPSSRGPYVPPDTSGWQIRKPVEIFSDGPSIGEDKGFQPYGGSKDGTVFQLRGTMGRDFYIHDTVISSGVGAPAVSGRGDFIRIATDTLLARIVVERVWMLYAGRSAIYFPGSAEAVGVTLRDVNVYQCGGHGIFLNNTHLFNMTGGGANGCKGMGMVMLSSTSGIHISGAYFESNGGRMDGASDVTIPQDNGVNYNAQLLLGGCSGVSITGNNFEDAISADSTDQRIGLTLNACSGAFVGGNEFDNGSAMQNTKSINLINFSRGNTIAANYHTYVHHAVYIASASDDYGNAVLPQYVATATNVVPGNVTIPAGGYNFAVITNQSLTGATNKVAGILLPTLSTNGEQPDSLTGTNGAYTTILQGGLLAFGGGDSLFVRRSTTGGWKVIK